MHPFQNNHKTMTVQDKEILIFRNSKFTLFGAPLIPFFEKNTQLNFKMLTKEDWRSYQGSWLLKDDNLYITSLKSSNYTFKDLFNSTGPVLADWYSGMLKFGIGFIVADDESVKFHTFVWLKIANGKVVDKKITKDIDSNFLISFGKYKGKYLYDILYGKINKNLYATINDLFECVLSFILKNDDPYNVQCGHFNINAEDINFINETRKYGIEYFLTQKYIATRIKVFWETSNFDNRAEKMSGFLEKILRLNYSSFAVDK